jgi:hypothetical protein
MVKEDIRSMLWLDEGADQVSRSRATRSGRFGEALVAVFVRLEDEGHGDLRGHSFLEAGFGHCNPSPQRPAFRSPDDAQNWVLGRLSRST